MSGHTSEGHSHCQNCGTALTGPYCSACGQHDVDYHRSIWPILEDSLEGFLHFDGKFFRTVRWLFTRPGFLTNEFITGRRVAYTQPLRLYIFVSFIYFASGIAFNENGVPKPATSAAPEVVAAKGGGGGVAAAPTARLVPIVTKPAAIGKLVEGLEQEDPKEISAELRHLAPSSAFFCIPFLAMALMIAYPRSGRVFVEHLIFALHLQTLFFICALATSASEALLRLVSDSLAQLAGFLAFLGGWLLMFCALREVYGGSRVGTFFKMMVIATIYGIILLFGVTLTAIVAALLVLKK